MRSETAVDAARVTARGAEVLALYARGLTWVSFRPIPDRDCALDLSIRRLPGLGLLSGTVRGVRHEHRRAENAGDMLSFHVNHSGLSLVAGRGREFVLGDGDAVLLSTAEDRSISRPGTVAHSVLRLPRASVAPLVPGLDDALLRAIPRGTGPLRLLTAYADALLHDPALADPATQGLAATHLGDLLALTIGASRDGAAAAERRGLRAARLRAVKADIEAHLADETRSPAAVARRQGISESYVRKLLEAEGTSYSAHTLARRLARARRLLESPAWSGRGVASVAFACGFNDLSYFNRSFRRAYGATPSEVRRGAGGT